MPKKKQDSKRPKLPEQLVFIEKAKVLTLNWAIDSKINILDIDLVAPSILEQKRFSVWFFFDTDIRLKEYAANGTIQQLQNEFLSSLEKQNYPADYFEDVRFFTDTQENIDRFAKMQPVSTM